MLERTIDLETTTWTLVYDRQGQDMVSIDAEDLADTLQALRQIVQRSNQIVNGAASDASLRVLATRPGSFDLVCQMSVMFAGAMVPMASQYGPAVMALKTLLFGGSDVEGIFNIFKYRRGHPIRPQNITADVVNIVEGDVNYNITVDEQSILQDVIIQTGMRDMVRPMQRGDVDVMSFRDDDREMVTFHHDDFDWRVMETVASEEFNTINIDSQRLRVVAPNLGNPYAKWRLSDGSTTNWYSILDESFLKRVTDGEERFGTGDTLECRVRIVQSVDDMGKIRSEYLISRVATHYAGGVQLALPEV
ncbi:MAG: hypothetical protein OXI54_09305 [Chloroflexota bacterium]|nr:hypothetical protein [Chloroflexota bacterium]